MCLAYYTSNTNSTNNQQGRATYMYMTQTLGNGGFNYTFMLFYFQIGLIGLVEWEWLVTLATIEPEDLEYTDFVDCARQLLPALQDQVCG